MTKEQITEQLKYLINRYASQLDSEEETITEILSIFLPKKETSKEQNWIKEFDEKFPLVAGGTEGGVLRDLRHDLKPFISALLTSQRESLREELEHKIRWAIGLKLSKESSTEYLSKEHILSLLSPNEEKR